MTRKIHSRHFVCLFRWSISIRLSAHSRNLLSTLKKEKLPFRIEREWTEMMSLLHTPPRFESGREEKQFNYLLGRFLHQIGLLIIIFRPSLRDTRELMDENLW